MNGQISLIFPQPLTIRKTIVTVKFKRNVDYDEYATCVFLVCGGGWSQSS